MNKANAFTHPSKKNPLKRHTGLLKDKTYWCIGKGGEKFVKYYSGQQFEFMKLPTVLIKDPKYKYISEKAKIVFAICLNKAELSIKNGWIDKYSKIFIYYRWFNSISKIYWFYILINHFLFNSSLLI